MPAMYYKKLSYHGYSARCLKRPFEVTQGHPFLCQSTRHICSVVINDLTAKAKARTRVCE